MFIWTCTGAANQVKTLPLSLWLSEDTLERLITWEKWREGVCISFSRKDPHFPIQFFFVSPYAKMQEIFFLQKSRKHCNFFHHVAKIVKLIKRKRSDGSISKLRRNFSCYKLAVKLSRYSSRYIESFPDMRESWSIDQSQPRARLTNDGLYILINFICIYRYIYNRARTFGRGTVRRKKKC